MTVIRTTCRQRMDQTNRPDGCRAASAGQFVIRADGTARFDRHYHDVDEFWFVAEGTGAVLAGDTEHDIVAGDIIYTRAGQEHDVITVGQQLRIFWLTWETADGSSAAHLHRDPAHAARHAVPVRTQVTSAGARDD